MTAFEAWRAFAVRRYKETEKDLFLVSLRSNFCFFGVKYYEHHGEMTRSQRQKEDALVSIIPSQYSYVGLDS